MPTRVQRRTVDLSAYPDLVVVYLGMRVNRLTGLKMLFGTGPKIDRSVAARPDGLLHHELFFWSLFPRHAGNRKYRRDYLRNSDGTGFWHETYFRSGGMEALDDGMPDTGFLRFAPAVPARGAMFSSRACARLGAETKGGLVKEEELYS